MLLILAALIGCSQGGERTAPSETPQQQLDVSRMAVEKASLARPQQSVEARLDQVAAEVNAWRGAHDLGEAKRHAEAARNLIVGPTGPGYGDNDGDGTISGANEIGLLPGLEGGAALAVPAANACIHRDLLGGGWEDPRSRWATLKAAIAAWRPGNNTFPQLPSHAQRVVGWATLALNSPSPELARDYAAHANIHVEVSRSALADC